MFNPFGHVNGSQGDRVDTIGLDAEKIRLYVASLEKREGQAEQGNLGISTPTAFVPLQPAFTITAQLCYDLPGHGGIVSTQGIDFTLKLVAADEREQRF